MGDINTKFHPSSGVSVDFSEASDVAVRFSPSADIAINIPSDIAAVSPYVAEYQTVYDSFTNKPTAPDDTRQNAWVEADVADGVWDTKNDVQYNHAIHTNLNGEAQTNWINPGTFDCTLVNAPTFVAFEGFTGDGATASIDWNWSPGINGVKYLLNTACVFAYVRNNIQGTGPVIGIRDDVGTATIIQISPRLGDDRAYCRINANLGGNANVASLDSRGMWIAIRSDSSNYSLERNKSVFASNTRASSARSDINMYSLCWNDDNVPAAFSSFQLSMAAAGYMDKTERDNKTDNFETYMDAYGKGVIP